VFASTVLDDIRNRCSGAAVARSNSTADVADSRGAVGVLDEVAQAIQTNRRESEKEAALAERVAGADAILASAANLNGVSDAASLREAEAQLTKTEKILREYLPALAAARDRNLALADMLVQKVTEVRAAATNAETALSKTVAQISVAENAKRNIQVPLPFVSSLIRHRP